MRRGSQRINDGGKRRRFRKRPSEHDSVEFGPDGLQQLRVQEVLTQAECAPVTGAHAAQPGVAEERRREHTHQHKYTNARGVTDTQEQDKHRREKLDLK